MLLPICEVRNAPAFFRCFTSTNSIVRFLNIGHGCIYFRISYPLTGKYRSIITFGLVPKTKKNQSTLSLYYDVAAYSSFGEKLDCDNPPQLAQGSVSVIHPPSLATPEISCIPPVACMYSLAKSYAVGLEAQPSSSTRDWEVIIIPIPTISQRLDVNN